MSHRDHDRRLHGYAREMRRSPSDAERRMWWLLRNQRLGAFRFNRQVPMLGYIVDFVCKAEKLIVEVDGSQHGEESSRRYDEARTRVLNEAGFRVIRFWAVDVMKEEVAVARTIHRELQNRPKDVARVEPAGLRRPPREPPP